MTDYYLAWNHRSQPADMCVVKCDSEIWARKISFRMTGLKYSHIRNIKIINIEKVYDASVFPRFWLTYRKLHTYKKNYDDIIVYYGTQKSAISHASNAYDLNRKDIGVREITLGTIEYLDESDDNTSESESEGEPIIHEPSFINLNMDIGNINSIGIDKLLNQIKCEDKYIIHNCMVHRGRDPNDANDISFVGDYKEFCEIVVDFYKQYLPDEDDCDGHNSFKNKSKENDLHISYSSCNDTSCKVLVYYYNDFDSQYQIFGVDKNQQEIIKKSIEKSLKKIGVKLE